MYTENDGYFEDNFDPEKFFLDDGNHDINQEKNCRQTIIIIVITCCDDGECDACYAYAGGQEEFFPDVYGKDDEEYPEDCMVV